MLRIVGDICFTDNHFDVGFGVGSAIKKGSNPFCNITKAPEDCWIGNFECVTSDKTVHSNYRKDCFRIEPSLLKQCQLFDYLGIANNHVMEHGSEAYLDMECQLKAICKGTFGTKQNKSITFSHQGKSISVTGFSLRREEGKDKPLYWSMPDASEITAEFATLTSDLKIAYIHWGVEFINFPSIDQIRFAHWLIDLGYDLIIGMHPHILQGYEVYKGKHIFYSLGNFVFNMAYSPTKYSIVVSVDVDNWNVTYKYIHIMDDYTPVFVDKQEVPNSMRLSYLNKLVGQVRNPEEYIHIADKGLKSYRKAHHWAFIKNLYRYDFRVLFSILFDFIKRKIK